MTSTQSSHPAGGNFASDTVIAQVAGSLSHADMTGVRVSPLPVLLTYRRSQPFEVGLTFFDGHAPGVTWTVGRDLLEHGLTASCTDPGGALEHDAVDIRIGTYALPDGDRTVITLAPPSATPIEIALPTYDLVEFAARTEDLVALGSEAHQLDDEDYHFPYSDPGSLGGPAVEA